MTGLNGADMLIFSEYIMLMTLYGLTPAKTGGKRIFAMYGILMSICLLLAAFGYISADLHRLDGLNYLASMIIIFMLIRAEYKRRKSV
ncbi:MAG: hypothetical protein AB7F40_11480 [Victivallaceae bacterium]|nr:hypothetical protein [Victivallaceae bacterium]